jgi:hypothetical protein
VRFPDRARYIISRGIVRFGLEPRARPGIADRAAAHGPIEHQLTGNVLRVLPDLITVPPSARAALDARRSLPSDGSTALMPAAGPQYAVVIRYGARLEPSVDRIDALPR